jgi:hypothetical protein
MTVWSGSPNDGVVARGTSSRSETAKMGASSGMDDQQAEAADRQLCSLQPTPAIAS